MDRVQLLKNGRAKKLQRFVCQLFRKPTDWCVRPLASRPSTDLILLSSRFQLSACPSGGHPSQKAAGFFFPKEIQLCKGFFWLKKIRGNAHLLSCEVFAWHCPHASSNNCYLPFNFASAGFYS